MNKKIITLTGIIIFSIFLIDQQSNADGDEGFLRQRLQGWKENIKESKGRNYNSSETKTIIGEIGTSEGFPSFYLDFFDATKVHPQAKGFQSAFYDENMNRVIFIPWGGPKEPLSILLAYYVNKDFRSAASYDVVDLAELIDPAAQGFGAGFMDCDRNWLYFCPFRKKEGDRIISNSLAVRFDLRKSLSDPTAYETFDLSALNLSSYGWVYGGCAGGYAYYAPTMVEGERRMHGLFLRYDTSRSFDDPDAWECFDLIKNVHRQAIGFQSVEVKPPYIYLIPFGKGYSYLVRYNINKPFRLSSSYEVIDMKSFHSNAAGYTLSIVAGDKIIFTPWRDRSQPALRQSMSVAAVFDTRKSLDDISAWSFFDLTQIHPGAAGYQGGWFDKEGFVYFVPTGNFATGGVPPFVVWDSKKPFDQARSWKVYSSTGVPPSTGAAYDGANCVWLAPYGSARHLSGVITSAL